MGYLDSNGLTYFWSKIKAKFAPIQHTHDAVDIDGLSDYLDGDIYSARIDTYGNLILVVGGSLPDGEGEQY